MRQVLLTVALILAAPLARADVATVIDDHILPGHARFAEATAALEAAAGADCTPPSVQPAYNDAFDAWLGIAHLRLGPIESRGYALAIAFWPDARGMVPKTLARLIASEDPVVAEPDAFAEVSVAARGFFALERMLYDPDFSGYGPQSYSCDLTRAIAADLARMAADLDADWRDTFAETLRSAGAPGNEVFLTDLEGVQALFTALTTGLEFNAETRIARPLGSFERPRPERAEARRSGRSLRNVVVSLDALRELAETLAGEAPATEAAFASARDIAAELDDPVFAGVADPTGRLRVEILQQRIQLVRDAARAEIGPALGVAAGFNSMDGD